MLEYRGGNQSATCKALTTTSTNIDEIYWEDDRGKNISLEWVADTHNWDLRPVCTAKFKGIGICQKTLDVTFYSMCTFLHYFNSQMLAVKRKL